MMGNTNALDTRRILQLTEKVIKSADEVSPQGRNYREDEERKKTTYLVQALIAVLADEGLLADSLECQQTGTDESEYKFSYRDVLHSRNSIDLDALFKVAQTTGYPYFIWGNRLFKVEGRSFSDTGKTLDEVM